MHYENHEQARFSWRNARLLELTSAACGVVDALGKISRDADCGDARRGLINLLAGVTQEARALVKPEPTKQMNEQGEFAKAAKDAKHMRVTLFDGVKPLNGLLIASSDPLYASIIKTSEEREIAEPDYTQFPA